MHGSEVNVLEHEKLVWARITGKLPSGDRFTNKKEETLYVAWDYLLEQNMGKEERCSYI